MWKKVALQVGLFALDRGMKSRKKKKVYKKRKNAKRRG